MTNKETTSIALKCFAIYILTEIIICIPTIAVIANQRNYVGEDGASTVWIIITTVTTFIFGIIAAFLIWESANSLMNKDTTDDDVGSLDATGIMKIFLLCLGVYYVINALVALPAAIAIYNFSRTPVSDSNPNALMSLVTQVIKLTFGALLIAKPSKWVKAVRSIGDK